MKTEMETEMETETDKDTQTETDQIGRQDNVANVILGKGYSAALASAPGLELHHPIMSMLGVPGGRLDRERDSA